MHCIECDKPFVFDNENDVLCYKCNKYEQEIRKPKMAYTEELIKLEAKRDALDYARQVVNSMLYQEIEKNGQAIHREKEKLKQAMAPSETKIQQKINTTEI